MPLSVAKFVDRLRRFGVLPPLRSCRVCGCTEQDCAGCIARTGRPCYWVDEDLCSACAPSPRCRGTLDPAVATAQAMMQDRPPPRR